MNDYVLIRSCKYGLEVHLNHNLPFDELKIEVQKKFAASSKFFKNAKLAISFEERILSTAEEQELIAIISEVAGVEILCVIDNNRTRNVLYRSILEQSINYNSEREAQFYRGTLKRRQVLESDENIIIMGNVEVGAKVIAKGNIVVLGEIKGHVHAGMGGNNEAFIVGLKINAKSLKINEINANRHILLDKNDIPNIPKIAIIDGEHIYIDPLL